MGVGRRLSCSVWLMLALVLMPACKPLTLGGVASCMRTRLRPCSRIRTGIGSGSGSGLPPTLCSTAVRMCEANEVSQPDAKPTEFKSSFLQTLSSRGFIHQCTDYQGLDDLMSQQTINAYLGFDATAPSLHVGSLLQIMILRHLQKAGHKPIILIGGGTTKIGDPSGKDESRKLLSEEQIQQNADSLSQVFKKFLKFGDGPTDAVMVDNSVWLGSLQYINFLRDYGRLFTINRMLTFESVKQRLAREQPLTFLEFNYMILQAYDFLTLFRSHNCRLQMGGSDQWGNIVNGVELTRKVEQATVYGLTAPLITTSDGKKMGKTAGGAVWLDKTLLGEYEYWQFWRNTADADVVRFLNLFTEIPQEELAVIETWEGAKLNDAKLRLADECTMMLHGEECLKGIRETVNALFGGCGADLSSLPTYSIDAGEVTASGGVSLLDLLVLAELASTKSEARRLVRGGGARLNGQKVEDEAYKVGLDAFGETGTLQLSSGKKKHALVQLHEQSISA